MVTERLEAALWATSVESTPAPAATTIHLMGPASDTRILFVVAMEAEAAPIRAALGLEGPGRQLHHRFPALLAAGDRVAVATTGLDPRFGVDSIATQPAAITALHAIEQYEPTLVVSAGTAGGFLSAGGSIGAVFLADRVVFHDRRVAIPQFEPYGIGDYPVADLSEAAERLGRSTAYPVGVGTISSGNALDAPDVDLAAMATTNTVAKDMEAAAVAWVCEQMQVGFAAAKAITDLVDADDATADQFLQNLGIATMNLADFAPRLVAELSR